VVRGDGRPRVGHAGLELARHEAVEGVVGKQVRPLRSGGRGRGRDECRQRLTEGTQLGRSKVRRRLLASLCRIMSTAQQ
jgi:hypothetical protein